jgi:hypothetical protein
MHYTESKILNIKYYWYAWLGAVSIFLILRYVILINASEHTKYTLFSTYALLTWLPLMGIGAYHGWKLRHFLDKYHPIIFKKFYSHAYGMITIDDPIGLFKFHFSKETFEDEKLNKIKEFQKQLFFFVLAVFFSYPLLFLAGMI